MAYVKNFKTFEQWHAWDVTQKLDIINRVLTPPLNRQNFSLYPQRKQPVYGQ
jgi:hypothetical protein